MTQVRPNDFVLKAVLVILLVIVVHIVYGQESIRQVDISFGYSFTPLSIERTKATRWMIYPAISLKYRLRNKISLSASYLLHDLRIGHLSHEQSARFKEVPPLFSYEMAKMYEGRKFTLTYLSDYVFAGVHLLLVDKKALTIHTVFEVGYRQGETSVLEFVIEHPSWPNGFEVHADIQSSDSPGLKHAIVPELKFGKLISLEMMIGSFVFINWPVIQPFGNLQLCLSI